jgi:hypothetical protein
MRSFTPSPILAIALLLSFAGCASSFDPEFNRAAGAALDPSQPIVGAWSGEWSTEDGSTGGPARLVVTRRGTATDTLDLELFGFPTSPAGERFTAEATVDPRGGPVNDFTAKVPAILVQGDLCAAALGLQAHVDGNAMRVGYWLNDALQQIDAGHIELRRAGTPATRP